MKIYFDGACEPRNPGGNMGWGVVIVKDDGNIFGKFHGFQPEASQNSNNVAEYLAFKLALESVSSFDKFSPILILGDSQLVIKQMSSEWKIKQGRYVNVAQECLDLLHQLRSEGWVIGLQWIPREKNKLADDVSKVQFKSRNILIKDYGKG
jgi:ribonuclease HI